MATAAGGIAEVCVKCAEPMTMNWMYGVPIHYHSHLSIDILMTHPMLVTAVVLKAMISFCRWIQKHGLHMLSPGCHAFS